MMGPDTSLGLKKPGRRIVLAVEAGDSFHRRAPMESTPQYAVGWGTLSLINAGLAQTKNRSALSWWFFSLFLGPIATLLIVVLDAPRNRSDQR